MESWVFLNVGAVVIAKSHNLSEPQVVSYMLAEVQTCTLSTGIRFLDGYCVRVLANNIGYNFYFSLVLGSLENCMFILLCSCTLDLPPWGGGLYFHLCTELCLGGSLAFAVFPQKCAWSFPVAHHPPVSQVSVKLHMIILWKHVSDLTWTSLSKYFIAIMMWQVLAV